MTNSFWWAGPIAFRNLPTLDGRGITKTAPVTLRRGGGPVLAIGQALLSDAINVGKVMRVWDRCDDEIWAQLYLHEDVATRGPFYPALDTLNYELDDEPAPWFTELEVTAITLVRDRSWERLRPITLPL